MFHLDFDSDPDPNLPPPPLHEEYPSGGCSFRFREGGRIVLRNRRGHTPQSLFMNALFGSYVLDGQPMRCTGIVPGVSLRIEVKRPLPTECAPEDFLARIWLAVQPTFEQWLADAKGSPGVEVEFDKFGIRVQFARDELLHTRPGVMQIDVLD